MQARRWFGVLVVGVRVVLGGYKGPQRGEATPDRPGQQGTGGAPGQGGPPREAGVEKRRLVKEGYGSGVPRRGLQ